MFCEPSHWVDASYSVRVALSSLSASWMAQFGVREGRRLRCCLIADARKLLTSPWRAQMVALSSEASLGPCLSRTSSTWLIKGERNSSSGTPSRRGH